LFLSAAEKIKPNTDKYIQHLTVSLMDQRAGRNFAFGLLFVYIPLRRKLSFATRRSIKTK
jgi:hypothetical protein